MSESLMMVLAGRIGRDRAHDLVYEAVGRSRVDGRSFAQHAREILEVDYPHEKFEVDVMEPHAYLGEAREICSAALEEWSR